MNYLAQLQQFLDFYDKNMGSMAGGYVDAPHGAISQLGPVRAYGGPDDRSRRMLWAEKMIGAMPRDYGSQDFFQNDRPANTLIAGARAAQQPAPGPVSAMSPRAIEEASGMRSRQVPNVLARFGGRY